MMEKFSGPILVALGSLLWGTDSLFRFPIVEKMDPTFIVWVEHVLGLLVFLPWILSRYRDQIFKLGFKEWICAFIVGAGGGAIATVFFTASFRFLNPSVAILLQKLQPIITVLLAYGFLGERPESRFYGWALVAVAAGLVLSFPDLEFGFMMEPGNLHAKGVLYALGAASLWSVSTVAGKRFLTTTAASVATFWRYVFGLATLCMIMYLADVPVPAMDTMTTRSSLIALAYLSFATGIIPMQAYYAGLSRTPANVATFIELLHPISAVLLNTAFLHTPLSSVQMIAGGLLLLAVTMISK